MNYFLDTNICIYLINKRPVDLMTKFMQYDPYEIGISTVVISELRYGVSKSSRPKQNQKRLDTFLSPFQIVDYDQNAAKAYGDIRATLEKAGTPIGCEDLLIAAHALSAEVPIVTNNDREFKRVPGLIVENWVAD